MPEIDLSNFDLEQDLHLEIGGPPSGENVPAVVEKEPPRTIEVEGGSVQTRGTTVEREKQYVQEQQQQRQNMAHTPEIISDDTSGIDYISQYNQDQAVPKFTTDKSNEVDPFKLTAKLWFEENDLDFGEEEIKLMDDNGGGAKGFTALLSEIIEYNINTEYANPFVKEVDDFFKEGNTMEDFMDLILRGEEVDSIELDHDFLYTVEGQKYILAQNFAYTTDFSDDKIERFINSLERSGELEVEAKDAYVSLEKIKKQMEEERIISLEESKREREEEEFTIQKDIANFISGSTQETLGVNLSDSQKEGFYNFLVLKDNEGRTNYQNYLDSVPNGEIRMAVLAFLGVPEGKLPPEMKRIVTDELNKVLTSTHKTRNNSIGNRAAVKEKALDLSDFDL